MIEIWGNLATLVSEGTNIHKLLLLGLAGLVIIISFRRRSTFLFHWNPGSQVRGRDTAIPGEVAPGDWKPLKFAYPPIEPCLQPLTDIEPIAYRPYRGGPHHVTMGLRNMPWDNWIELDNQYERYHRIRQHRIDTRGDGAIRVLTDAHNPQVVKGGGFAAIELVHELAEYLSRRYPTTFRVTSRHAIGSQRVSGEGEGLETASLSPCVGLHEFCDWGWEGAPPIKAIHVGPLDKTYELPLHVNDGDRAPERALEVAALLIQDDLAIMIEGKDGRYYFQAGAIVVPGFWRLKDKIGLPLEEIHTSGDVPQYREKLEASMGRFFRRMTVNKPVSRNNYFVQIVKGNDAIDPEELGWSTTTNGPEDGFTAPHTHQGDVSVEEMRLRTERQTLRRLGMSGAIVFTIRTYLVRMTELGETKGRLGAALRGWPEDVRRYKGGFRGGWWERLVEYLE